MPPFSCGDPKLIGSAELSTVMIEWLVSYSNKSQGEVWLYVNQTRFVP